MYFYKREMRDHIVHSVNQALSLRNRTQLQIIRIKDIHRLNQTYGYDVCDKAIDIFFEKMKEIINIHFPKEEVFRIKGGTFVTVSQYYSAEDIELQGNLIYPETDKALGGIISYPDVIRCTIATIPLSRGLRSIDKNLLAKIEYYVHFYNQENEDIYMYDESFCEQMLRQADIKTRLRDALENEQIQFHFQPQYNSKNKVVAFESLARWTDEKLGVIAPNEFIPEFENSTFYKDFCRYAVAKSVSSLKTLHESGFENTSISINVMKKMFEDSEFADYIARIADESHINRNLITLEITETALPEPDSTIAKNIRKLRSLGFRIAIDDFGVGDSSFTRLMHLDFDELKLDREFISHIDLDVKACKTNRIIESICQMFKNLGVSVVIEGVEIKEQRDYVYDNFKIDLIQGFYYSRPLPLDDIIKGKISNPKKES